MAASSPSVTALDRAIAHHEAGELHRAEAIYRQILAEDPADLDALNLLGLLLQDQGQYAEAIETLSRAIEIDPDFPEALTNLARVRLTTGDVEQALLNARRAIELDPALPAAQLQLGRAYLEVRRFTDAEAAFRDCIDLESRAPDGHVFLGLCFAKQGRADEAVEAFERGRRLGAERSDTLIQMGAALGTLDKLDLALAYHARAVELAPASAAAHVALALTYGRRADPGASAAACRNALTLDPDNPDILLLLSTNLAFLGQFEEARAYQTKALSIRPDSPEALRDFAMLGNTIGNDQAIASLRRTLSDVSAPEAERITAGFALGTTLDRGADFDGAFQAYSVANALVHTQNAELGRGFDQADFTRTIDWLIHTFNDGAFTKDRVADDHDSSGLVFIVGMPRSGTSLIEQIVASHPLVFGGGERKDIGDCVRLLNNGRMELSPFEWDRQAAADAARSHISAVMKLAKGASRFTDKLPDNILLLGHIATMFPGARVIFCRRDPRDTCLSAYFQQFGESIPWTASLDDCAERALQIDRLAEHWLRVLPLRMIEADYESVIADQEGQSRRLIDFLGLPWDPACLAFHKTERAVMTASYWQVRQPLYSSAVGRWKHYKSHLAPLRLSLIRDERDFTEHEWREIAKKPKMALDAATRHIGFGRGASAAAIFHGLLSVQSDQPDAAYGLGLYHFDEGRIGEAITLLQQAAKAEPPAAPRYASLALALASAYRFDEAIEASLKATTIDPDYPMSWTSLGYAASLKGDWATSSDALKRAAVLLPDSTNVKIGLATASFERGELSDAKRLWQEVLDAEPENIEAILGMAATLASQQFEDEALPLAMTVAQMEPPRADFRFKLAFIFYLLMMPDKAAEQARKAVELAPEMAHLWVMLAETLGYMGDQKGAAEAYRQVLALDPASGSAFAGLLQYQPDIDPAEVIAGVKDRVLDETAPISDRVAASFAMAGAYNRLRDYDAAFAWYEGAHRLKRTILDKSDASEHLLALEELLPWIKDVFTEETFFEAGPAGTLSHAPVFVVGMPRSGTTLVEQIISSHSSVVGLGERTDIANILGLRRETARFEHPLAWDVGTIRERAANLLSKLEADHPGALRFVNKMPDNIQCLGQIAIIYPRAHIIVCRRDLRDVCWSCYTQNFTDPGMAWAETLEECAARARLIEQMTDLWLEMLPVPVLEVHYEELVNDIEAGARRLIDFIGLPWDPACLEFYKNPRAVMTASVTQVRRPVYGSSVGRWKQYRRHLQPMLDVLDDSVPADGET